MIANFAALESFNLKDKNVFISQPMKGKTTKEIETERKNLVEAIERNGGKVIDSVYPEFEMMVHKQATLICLARSIDSMANADVVIFMPGYENARGCSIELECCKKYDIDYILL